MNPNISDSFRKGFSILATLLLLSLGASAQSGRPHPPANPQNPLGGTPVQSPLQQVPGPRDLTAPDPSLGPAARLLAMSGQVSVLRGDAPWALSVGDTVNLQQIVVTGPDGYAKFRVADGSEFEVFQNSRVVFRNNPGDWRDFLDILIGKVKIQIEKFGGLPNPNKVRTPTAVISVRGTVFDVDVEDEDATTLVLVEEGQVEVRHLLKAGDGVLLNPGDWLRVYKNQPIAVKNFDRGLVVQRAFRAAYDAAYQAMINNPGKTSVPGGSTGGSGGQGDGCKPTTPNACNTAPPPPPPPPPPHD